jgi:hypothetical protein
MGSEHQLTPIGDMLAAKMLIGEIVRIAITLGGKLLI